MAERFKFNDEEENIDENDNQQDDLEKEYYDNTDYSYTKSKNKKRPKTKKVTRKKMDVLKFLLSLSRYLFYF